MRQSYAQDWHPLAKEIGNPHAVFQEQPIGVPLRITATAINPADESQPSAPVTLTLTQASEPRPPGGWGKRASNPL